MLTWILLGTVVFLPASLFCQSSSHESDRLNYIEHALHYLESWIDHVDGMLFLENSTDIGMWNPWSECSKSCGGGRKTRTRIDCPPQSGHCEDVLFCNTQPCSEAPDVRRYATCAVQPNVNFKGLERVNGVVRFDQTPGQHLNINLTLNGFESLELTSHNDSFEHGMHVHETGDMSNGCESLGAHYNPDNVTHGGRNASIRHVGDFGNILQTQSGEAMEFFTDPVASLFGERSIIGRGLVIHANRDDLGKGGNPESLIDGNSGPRLACCVIGFVEDVPLADSGP